MNLQLPTWVTVVIATGAATLPACSLEVVHGAPATSSGSPDGTGGGASSSGSMQSGAGGSGANTTSTSAGGAQCPPNTTTGSGAGPTSPLRVVSASVVSGTEVRLTFSEAVKPPAGVNAADFRLSAGEVLKPGKPSYVLYSMSGYSYSMSQSGPRYSICPISDGDYGQGCTQGDGAPCLETLYRDLGAFSTLAQTDDKDIVATLVKPIGSVGLERLLCGGIFLHYTEGSTPIEDLDGNPLDPIAPDWVHTQKPLLSVGGDAPNHPVVVEHAILDMYCAGHKCSDGLLDGKESDVDCGDVYNCPPCGVGKHCPDKYSCESKSCSGGICVAATCTDQQEDGTETDVDCGGPSCPPCAKGQGCSNDTDCQTNNCSHGVCKP